jgi:AcrR family transcriptional regulator
MAKSVSDKSAPTGRRRNRTVEVFDASVEVFYEKGYTAAAIQDVADVVGMLKGSLYYYIDSKEDLLMRICERVHVESRQMLAEALALDVSPLERLRGFIYAHVRWYLENRKMVGVYFRDWRFLTGEQAKIVVERQRGYAKSMRELIVAAKESGEGDPELNERYAAFYILAAVNAVPHWYRPQGRDSIETIASNYADLTVATVVGSHRQ